MAKKMEAEPCVMYKGKKSDASEHEYMLSREDSSKASDELAVAQAVKLGMSEKEARELIFGK